MSANQQTNPDQSLRILFVDDKRDSVQTAMDEVTRRLPGTLVKHATFGEARASISSFVPQIVVLDLREDATGDIAVEVGEKEVLNHVWDHRFCPVVIYSAFPDELVDKAKAEHPLVRTVKKGASSELEVADHAEQLQPFVTALEIINGEINRVLHQSMREVAVRVFTSVKIEQQRAEYFARSVRRRVAARMDERLLSGQDGPELAQWEHYLCPPIMGHLLTGDVLIEVGKSSDSPDSFRLVLSPSCDLVQDANRKPKVDSVLVARCKKMRRLIVDLAATKNKLKTEDDVNDLKEKIRPALTQGYSRSCLPLPQLLGVLPCMVADFRSLELIEIASIGEQQGARYQRVVSVDNPFQNFVAWAYSQFAARQGLPDRDFNAWTDEIIESLKNK